MFGKRAGSDAACAVKGGWGVGVSEDWWGRDPGAASCLALVTMFSSTSQSKTNLDFQTC